eukprot:scaffold206262_cov35-Tisochrysis_lutea.AAC.1
MAATTARTRKTTAVAVTAINKTSAGVRVPELPPLANSSVQFDGASAPRPRWKPSAQGESLLLPPPQMLAATNVSDEFKLSTRASGDAGGEGLVRIVDEGVFSLMARGGGDGLGGGGGYGLLKNN